MSDTRGSKQVDSVVDAANKIKVVLSNNPKYTFGTDDEPVGQKQLEQAITDLQDSHTGVLDKDANRTAAIIDRQTKLTTLRSLVPRGRSGIRSDFGTDSAEYQQSGCKRTSSRKKPTRKNGNGNGNGGTH